MTSLQMSSPPISISHRLFHADIQIPETQLQALFPFLAPPPERPGELAQKGVGCFTSLIFFKRKREICIFDKICDGSVKRTMFMGWYTASQVSALMG